MDDARQPFIAPLRMQDQPLGAEAPMTGTAAQLDEALRLIRAQDAREPVLALVLGSGLGAVAEAADNPVVFSTAALPGYPRSTVEGHKGQLVMAELEGRPVVFIQGRVHLYEGHPMRGVTYPIRLVQALGAQKLLVTNAAGGINPAFRPGTLMFITDHINYAFANPLAGPELDGGPRFVDLAAPYDPAWLARAEAVALQAGQATQRGVYLWTRGPSYETPAEIRAFDRLGADAVGMSTVPEVLQARRLGMDVLGLSTITNMAAGLHHSALVHEEVIEVGRQVRDQLVALVRSIVRETL